MVQALGRALLHVDAQLLIEAVACAERRLVVAEEHEHDRLGVIAERVDIGGKLLSGAGHAAEIVVHGVVGRIGDAVVRDVGLAPDEGVVRIGAVALIADTEREARLRGIARFPAFGPLGEECLVVRVAVQTVFIRQQVFVVAIEEVVRLEAEALVDLLAAVEPGVAGMAALRLIALLKEVAHEGLRVAAVAGLRVGVARQEGTLGIDRTAADGIGDERTGVALGLQGMEVRIGVLHKAVGDGPEHGQVGEALEHRCDDVDSLPLRNIRLGVGAEQVLCLPRGIAVRLLGHGLRQRIQEGVDKALRGIVLRVLPDVEEGGIRLHHAVIEICIAVPELPCTEAQQHDEHQRQNAEPPALFWHTAARPAVQDDRPGGDEGDAGKEHQREMQGILSDDARSLANGQEVLRHERVAAERDLEIVDEVHEEQQHGRDKEAEPCAVRGKISEGHEQCDRQQVQQVDFRHMQVGAEAAAGEIQRADHLQQHVQPEHGRSQQQDRQQPANGGLPLLRAQPLAQAALFRGAHVRM